MLRSIALAGCVAAASAFAPMTALPKAGTRAGENPFDTLGAARRRPPGRRHLPSYLEKGEAWDQTLRRDPGSMRGLAMWEDGRKMCRAVESDEHDMAVATGVNRFPWNPGSLHLIGSLPFLHVTCLQQKQVEILAG